MEEFLMSFHCFVYCFLRDVWASQIYRDACNGKCLMLFAYCYFMTLLQVFFYGYDDSRCSV